MKAPRYETPLSLERYACLPIKSREGRGSSGYNACIFDESSGFWIAMRLEHWFLVSVLSSVLFLGAACGAPPSQPPGAVDAKAEFRPTATIKDIMDSMVDPNADAVWESVAVTVSATGIENKAPHTDDEWIEVRRHAIPILEATNLLLIPGRRVAKPGEKAEKPDIELSPEEIEKLINDDRQTFATLAHGLHDAASAVLKAIDARNAEALLYAGDGLDKACENCHLKYWYPPNKLHATGSVRP